MHSKADESLVLQVPQPPAPSRHQVRVALKAVGINFFDLYVSMGLSPDASPPCPLGLEGAGIVEAAGDGVEYKIGDRVALHSPRGGAMADMVTVESNCVLLLPDAVSFKDGASLTVSYLTAYFALNYAGCLRDGGSILVHSAAGSVGWAATQLAKQMSGVTVFGTAASSKLGFITQNGVDHAISHDQDYMAEVLKHRPGGVSIVLDSLAGSHFSNSQNLLQPFGKVVLIGAKDMISASGPKSLQTEDVSPLRLIMNNIGVTGLHLNEVKKKSPTIFREAWQEVFKMAAAERISPRVHRCYSLEDAKEGCRQLLERLNVGKVVLEL